MIVFAARLVGVRQHSARDIEPRALQRLRTRSIGNAFDARDDALGGHLDARNLERAATGLVRQWTIVSDRLGCSRIGLDADLAANAVGGDDLAE